MEKAIKVTLRQRPYTKGKIGLYLDFYPPITHPKTGKPSRRESLGLYILDNPKGELERRMNKEKLLVAEEIRHKREIELLGGKKSEAKPKKSNKMEKFIVAEINKSWEGNFDENTPLSELICQRFETVINTNNKRGYKLSDWRFTSLINNGLLNETIIAVFVRERDYIIGKTEREHQQFIKCLACGKTSYHPDDVKHLYCGHCNKFHGQKIVL